MAEQEVIKHTKKVYKIWNSREHSIWHKVKEFLMEVFIIVFAITLSIWFHNRSEHAHQQEDVKQFLLGLRSDLKRDLEEMKGDKAAYQDQAAAFTYITSVKLNQELSSDSVKKYFISIFNTTALNPNNGRFEGFKSSGKIGAIENEELQNDIMDLYQENIVSLLASTERYVETKKQLFDFVSRNQKKLSDSTTNLKSILAQDEAQNICVRLKGPSELLSRYDSCINKANKIIVEINKEYGLRD
jgi:hypothetical protein